MKKFSILILTFITFVGINACSTDDDVVFTAQPDPEGIAFVNSFNSQYILTQGTAENTAERFVWNTIDVDVPTNLVYELQGSTDPEFESFDVMGSTGSNNVAVTVGQLLELAEDAGLDNDPNTEDMPNTGQLYFRVVASAGTAGELAHTSEVESLTVVLLEETEEEVDPRELYFVGNATSDNWNNNANNIPLFRDPANPGLYYYTGYFNAGEFKLLEELGAWQPQWGLQDGEVTSSDILGGDPGAFTVDAAGYYTFQVNVDEMTYSLEPYDASEAATYETIGILGDATPGGWDVDIDLTQSEFDSHIWYASDVELGDGEMKFRAADAWDVNWGADTPVSGRATINGSNIPVTEGVYDVWFNDITGRYILIPQGEE